MPDPLSSEVRVLAKPWVGIVGALFGGLTLIFFMGLVLLSIMEKEIPCSSRFLVVVVLAFGSALSAAFIGGTAAASGRVPISYAGSHPLQFSVAGGIAVLVIVMFLGDWNFSEDDCEMRVSGCDSEIEELASVLSTKRFDKTHKAFNTVKYCVLSLDASEFPQLAAERLVGLMMTDVGGPPIPDNLRALRSDIMTLARQVSYFDMSRLLRDTSMKEIDLVGMDFRGARLHGVDFSGAFMIETDFTGADLTDANFTEALIRNVDFKGANLTGVNFTDADWFNALNLTPDQISNVKSGTLRSCPTDVDGFLEYINNQYYYPFDSWGSKIQDELTTAWNAYLLPDGVCAITRR